MPLKPENVQKFEELFVGGSHAHGVWNPETRDARTAREPATHDDYVQHLEGTVGLGLVPIHPDGTCRFAALDIDVDTIDHKELHKQVVARGLPLNVCRSKSGGAHLYVFTKEPTRAIELINVLKKWRVALGFPNVEVFPKQPKVSKTNIGNWINLPYFDSENTVRYCVAAAGALSLADFLSSVVYWDGHAVGDISPAPGLIQVEQMPPCLQKLAQEGVEEGGRNSVLFQAAVFARKSNPNAFKDVINEFNARYCKRPLPPQEVRAIVQSVGGKDYQYKCNEDPMASRCDRATCLKMTFGIGGAPIQPESMYAVPNLSNCRKILTDPPRWIIEVNGVDVALSTEELTNFPIFRIRVFELTNELLYPQKREHWEAKIMALAQKTQEIEAPEDASESGMILDKVQDFFTKSEKTSGREDLLHGNPIVEGGSVIFRVVDLQKWLKAQLIKITNERLYQILHHEKCAYTTVRVKGKVVRAWTFPVERWNRQTEDFTPPKFDHDEDSI